MKKMTEKALLEAFAGESMAHMKYLIFSEIAEKEGMPNIARLFKAIAYAEQVHATNHARNLGLIKKTPDNLQTGIDGETYEVEEMYPVFNNTAKFQNEKGAEQSTHYALEAEKIHMKMYADAKNSAEKGKDIDIKEIYICPVCGFTHIGKPPEYCPVCGAHNSKFKKF
ncbi:MAG: rubrerythrin family protein [candidate division WOR-3 bacterium]|nr:rubrerythrin family protein [candidate division WOR-3 bacterium]